MIHFPPMNSFAAANSQFQRVGVRLRQGMAACALLWAMCGISAKSLAHHEIAGFDTNQVIEIRGEVRQVRWVNPHVSLQISGTAADGTEGLWTVEMAAPDELLALGYRREALLAGDRIVVYANPLIDAVPLSDGSLGARFVGAELVDGSLFGQTGPEAAIPPP